jgi:hypothetical protein
MSGFFKETPFPDQPPVVRPDLEKRAQRGGDSTRKRGLVMAGLFGAGFAVLGYCIEALN